MKLFHKLKQTDTITKIGIIALAMIAIYLIFLYLFQPLFMPDASMMGMGGHMMMFGSQGQRNLNIVSIFFAVVAGLLIWITLKHRPEDLPLRHAAERSELDIIKRALSDDEKKILAEIEKAGEITQDSLRFRLNWSKAKVSAILLQLDRMNLIQRERQGKTYKVFISQ